jgi:hypothetical protein
MAARGSGAIFGKSNNSTMRLKSLIFFFLWVKIAAAQPLDSCLHYVDIAGATNFAAADNLSNIYRVSGSNAVEKHDSTGRLVARYTNNRLGTARYLDTSNPLKIAVWYTDFQTVLFLDRNLTELGRLNLLEAGWPTVRCLATAWDGNLWVYDEASFRVLKISPAGEKIAESEPLQFVLRAGALPAPPMLRDNGQRVFLGCPGLGLLAFDQFAQHAQMLVQAEDFGAFEVLGNWLLRPAGQELDIWPIGTFEGRRVRLPALEGARYWLSGRRVLVARGAKLEVYGF